MLAALAALISPALRGAGAAASSEGSSGREVTAVLRIYSVILEIIRALLPIIDRIEQHDRDLGRQLRRALASVPLNTAEGSYSRGRNRAARYHSAAGSMNEVIAGVETAVAFEYVHSFDPELLDRMRRVVATLFKNAR
ncbi:MAG: four helix bundle protein [Deltaproteobacteria bacterium]|nr:four helix bundle protein [Deltaproteobacteria bacterium]